MNRGRSARDSTGLTRARSHVRAPGSSWQSKRQLPPPRAKAGSLPHPAARPDPRFPPSAPLARKPGCDLPRLHPTSPDAAPGRRAARGASPLCPGRPRSQTSALCATAASLETPRERRGPRALGRRTTGHTTRYHPAGVASARHLPQGGGASPPQESCPFSRKAPSPTFPPIHSPASRRSASRASRGRTRARPRPCTLPGATGPARLPPPPTSPCPHEGRCHLRRRPIPSTPAARGRALGTSVHHLRRPHQRSRPEPGRGLPPRRGRTPQPSAAAARTALSLGVRNRLTARRGVPAPTPRPPALACCDSALQLLLLAPPAVTQPRRIRSGRAPRRGGGGGGGVPSSDGGGKADWNPGEPTPHPRALATGLLNRPAAASVTPGRRGPAVCSGAGRRGLLGRAPGGGAGGEFAAPRLLPPARALPGRPEGRCLGADV